MLLEQEAIYKVRANSRRQVYVRLTKQEFLTPLMGDIAKLGEAKPLSEKDHAEKVRHGWVMFVHSVA